MSLLEKLFGPTLVVIDDKGNAWSRGAYRLFDDQQDTLIKDSVKRVKEQLSQIPEDKTTVFVLASDWKFGFIPTARIGYATRIGKGWEIHGEGFLTKADKGASIRAVWTK